LTCEDRGIKTELILASKHLTTGTILYTMRLTYPRFILPEQLTHRTFSRNTASSRAIPLKKTRRQVLSNPVIPIHLGAAQAGMQAYREVQGWRASLGVSIIKGMRNCCALGHWGLEKLGFHKQVANRYIEPWLYTTQLVSFTDINNFILQRDNEAAEPHIQVVARQIKQITNKVEQAFDQGDLGYAYIRMLPQGGWHLPMTTISEKIQYDIETLKSISAGRCAQVSYSDIENNQLTTAANGERICKKLLESMPKHFSPVEHQAQALYISADSPSRYIANFKDFVQYRKQFPEESGQ